MSKYKNKNEFSKSGLKGKAMIKRFLFAILSVFLIVSIAASAAAIDDSKTQKLVYLNINYKDSTLTVNDIAWGRGFLSTPQVDSNINLEKAAIKIFDSDDELLYESQFYISNKRMIDIFNEETGELSGGTIELNDINFSVTVPYFSKMSSIKIYSNYNDIILHGSKIKELHVKSWDKASVDDVKTKEKTEDISESLEQKSDDKTFILKLVDIIDNVYRYIFG